MSFIGLAGWTAAAIYATGQEWEEFRWWEWVASGVPAVGFFAVGVPRLVLCWQSGETELAKAVEGAPPGGVGEAGPAPDRALISQIVQQLKQDGVVLAPAAAAGKCPSCGAARHLTDRFCTACGLEYAGAAASE